LLVNIRFFNLLKEFHCLEGGYLREALTYADRLCSRGALIEVAH